MQLLQKHIIHKTLVGEKEKMFLRLHHSGVRNWVIDKVSIISQVYAIQKIVTF